MTTVAQALNLPTYVQAHPMLTQWFSLDHLPMLTVYSGKVELGQGIQTALQQIACQELGITMEQIHWVAGNTLHSPNEWYTAGSQSIENGGALIRCALSYARWLFLQAASKELSVPVEQIEIRAGIFSTAGNTKTLSYLDLAPKVNIAVPVQALPEAIASAAQVKESIIGQSVSRKDLIEKLSSGAFIHDVVLPDMYHARMIRHSHAQSTIESVDIEAIKALNGVDQVLRSGSFLAIIGKNEAALVNALPKAHALVQWNLPSFVEPQRSIEDILTSLPASDDIVYNKGEAGVAVTKMSARYSRPFIAHASIGPACALAKLEDGHLTVWSHTQGSHLLRDQIAVALRQDARTIDVIHLHGAGCYGHNSADDVAFDAAFIAQQTGLAIRVQWMREEELSTTPFGSAKMMQIDAGIDANGRIVSWDSEIWSPTHIARPGCWTGTINLLGAWMIDPPHPVDATQDVPLPNGGGLRNAVAIYDFHHQAIRHHMLPQVPVRTSALRSLGAYLNVYAIESFLDELADSTGQDPVELRLSYLSDPRSKAIIQRVAEMADWSNRDKLPEGTALGIGFGRYKNFGAYCAIVAQVRVEEKIYVEKVWSTVDAGRIINPDGLTNQIEGGIIQAISWTLKEQATWDDKNITSNTWDTYPILNFSEVPEVVVELLDQPEAPSLGGGEAAAGPMGAAIGNALFAALGVRARHLPLSPDRLAQLIAS
jgi:CO/xanthine dehydrogenase Mo-binding subunit